MNSLPRPSDLAGQPLDRVCDWLTALLDVSSRDAIAIIQTYSLGIGIDVAIWQESAAEEWLNEPGGLLGQRKSGPRVVRYPGFRAVSIAPKAESYAGSGAADKAAVLQVRMGRQPHASPAVSIVRIRTRSDAGARSR